MRCSGLCPRKPRGLVRASPGALGLKHMICGCCRVTSQKRLSSRLQALSSLFFAVMPGKSASRQRSYERYSRDVNEPIDVHAKSHAMFERESRESQAMFTRESRESSHVHERAICDWRVVFQQSDLALPTGGLSNPIVRMGRSPAHVQACWAGTFR